MSSLRQLQTGRPYTFPPVTQGVPPDSATGAGEWRGVVTRAAALVGAARGGGGNGGGKSGGGSRSGGSSGAAAGPPSAGPQQEEGGGAPAAVRPPAVAAGAHGAAGAAVAPVAAAAVAPEAVAAGVGVGEGAVRAFMGVSPSLMSDLCEAAGVDPSTPATALSDAQWGSLYQQWEGWLSRVQAGPWDACCDTGLMRYSVLGVLPVPHQSVTALLEMYYGEVQVRSACYCRHRTPAGEKSTLDFT